MVRQLRRFIFTEGCYEGVHLEEDGEQLKVKALAGVRTLEACVEMFRMGAETVRRWMFVF